MIAGGQRSADSVPDGGPAEAASVEAAGPDGDPRRPSGAGAPVPDASLGLVTLEVLAAELSLPKKWIRRKARAGELPCIKIGPRLMFSIPGVGDWLRRRAARENEQGRLVY